MSDRCNEYREKIAGVLSGDITAADADSVEQHLLYCPDCLRFHQELLKDDQLLTEFVRSADHEVERLEGLVMRSIEDIDVKAPPVSDGRWWGVRMFGSTGMKVAAAALVVVAVVAGASLLDRNGGSDVVWAEMIRQVDEAQDYICRLAQSNTADPNGDLEMVQYRSEKYGLRMDIYRDGALRAAMHLKPSSGILYTVVHRDRTYTVAELSEEDHRLTLNESNARKMVESFKSLQFEEIGNRKVDGATASGIEIVDPPEYEPVFEETTIRMWVDVETRWPVRIEFEATAKGGDVRIEQTMYDFQWNPSLSEEDFQFEIPDDYRLLGRMEAPRTDQGSAIEGLRAYAALTGGRYPSVLSFTTAIYEAEDGFRRHRRDRGTMQDRFDEYSRIGNACAFYGELVEGDRDPAYYGDDVGPGDFDRVLMRWRLEDGRYRVVYGDLRTEDVSPGRLVELEQR